MFGTIAEAEKRLDKWRNKARGLLGDIGGDYQSSFKVDIIADALADAYQKGQREDGGCPCCGRPARPRSARPGD